MEIKVNSIYITSYLTCIFAIKVAYDILAFTNEELKRCYSKNLLTLLCFLFALLTIYAMTSYSPRISLVFMKEIMLMCNLCQYQERKVKRHELDFIKNACHIRNETFIIKVIIYKFIYRSNLSASQACCYH